MRWLVFMAFCSCAGAQVEPAAAPKATEDAPPLGVRLTMPKLGLPDPAPAIPCDATMTQFDADPVPFDKSLDIKQGSTTWKLRPGVLLSECAFVEAINTRTEHTRMAKELTILKGLWDITTASFVDVENQYQTRIVDLENQLKEEREISFWDEWGGTFIFAGGVGFATLVAWGFSELIQPRIVVK